MQLLIKLSNEEKYFYLTGSSTLAGKSIKMKTQEHKTLNMLDKHYIMFYQENKQKPFYLLLVLLILMN